MGSQLRKIKNKEIQDIFKKLLLNIEEPFCYLCVKPYS